MRRMSALQRRYFGKRSGSRRSARSIGRFSRRKSSGGSSGMGGDIGIALGAAAYGAGREWISQKAQPITTPLMGVFGNYADEALFLGLGWALRHGKIPGLGKFKMARDFGTAVMVVEAARIGSGIGGGLISSSTTVSTGTNW